MIETIHSFGYLGIFITIIIETGFFGFFLPADSLLFASGILVTTGRMNLIVLFSVVVVASVLGGHLGYYIGKTFGKDRIRHNNFFSIDEEHFHRAEVFFQKYGALAILVSRFTPIVRTFISPTLGIVRYDKYKFAMYNLIASLLWASSVILSGIVLGNMFPNLVHYLELIVIVGVVVACLPVVVKAIQKALDRRKK